jgi:hypothetical protein
MPRICFGLIICFSINNQENEIKLSTNVSTNKAISCIQQLHHTKNRCLANQFVQWNLNKQQATSNQNEGSRNGPGGAGPGVVGRPERPGAGRRRGGAQRRRGTGKRSARSVTVGAAGGGGRGAAAPLEVSPWPRARGDATARWERSGPVANRSLCYFFLSATGPGLVFLTFSHLFGTWASLSNWLYK